MVLTLAQFDVHEVSSENADYAEYLVELQSDLVAGLDTTIVAPLIDRACAGPLMKRLHPTVTVAGKEFVMRAEELVSLPRSALGRTVGSLKHDREALTAALDLLFLGV